MSAENIAFQNANTFIKGRRRNTKKLKKKKQTVMISTENITNFNDFLKDIFRKN